MHKLAVFVEGLTEIIFIERLIGEIAGTHDIFFDKRRIVGGSQIQRRVVSIQASKPMQGQQFYVLLFDCGGDHQVKPRIVEQHAALTKSGFSAIIGLRDVRPNTARQDIPLLERNLRYGIKAALAPVDIILAIMELEAWFLAEFSHFEKIDPTLTPERIESSLGFNPERQDMALRDVPALDIDRAYAIAGKNYNKPATQTIEILDYSKIYVELAAKIPHLGHLVSRIDSFLDL